MIALVLSWFGGALIGIAIERGVNGFEKRLRSTIEQTEEALRTGLVR